MLKLYLLNSHVLVLDFLSEEERVPGVVLYAFIHLRKFSDLQKHLSFC